jgi:uncharacterized protein YqjF (DUF2071 family)
VHAEFLTAEWRHLAMLNYEVDPALLAPFVPRGTTLDTWNGATFISIVGFHFRHTRVLSVPIPFHRHFEEVNLRLYVRREEAGEIRRGVTFIRELVPRRAIAYVARLMYNEPYTALPMRHRIRESRAHDGTVDLVEYEWRHASQWTRLAVEPVGPPQPLRAGSEEEFITEHYWGYTVQRDGGTVEYRVEHPRWNVWQVSRSVLEGNLIPLYGPAFGAILRNPPSSAFLADGSSVRVMMPRRLPAL